jgi:multicomponent Na+:H+ antiporter subunit C
MTRYAVFALAAVALFSIGLHGVITRRHLVRKIIALNIAASGVFMLFLSFGVRHPGEGYDPVPHAMVLTGIVVAFGATAFALALAARIEKETGRAALDQSERPGFR